jgi:hypothetical protein
MAKSTTPEPEEGVVSEAALKSNLLSQAATELKNRHVAEYEVIATALFEKHGLKRVRRLSPEERKLKELHELAAELGLNVVAPTESA